MMIKTQWYVTTHEGIPMAVAEHGTEFKMMRRLKPGFSSSRIATELADMTRTLNKVLATKPRPVSRNIAFGRAAYDA